MMVAGAKWLRAGVTLFGGLTLLRIMDRRLAELSADEKPTMITEEPAPQPIPPSPPQSMRPMTTLLPIQLEAALWLGRSRLTDASIADLLMSVGGVDDIRNLDRAGCEGVLRALAKAGLGKDA